MQKGFVAISRPSFGNDKEAIVIRIGDEATHSQIMEVHLTYRDFALAMTGMSHTPCQFETSHLDRLGKVKQFKSQEILIPKEHDIDTPEELLAPFEVDGWVGDRSDLKNHHRRYRVDDQVYATVSFTRYVEPTAA